MPGIDPIRVEAWMSTLRIGAAAPLTFTPIGEGKSNITALVNDAGGRSWVLRRPPLGPLLPTAHDIAREHRILSALEGTAVPTPTPIALALDPAVSEAPLMLMERVEGVVLGDASTAAELSPAVREAAGKSLVTALATLHEVDLEAVALVDLASHRSFARRQLKRWSAQWADSRTRDLPLVDALAGRLTSAAPEQEDLVLVHGDCHLLNALIDDRGSVQAILDWELSTLGDPLADLGLLLAYWPQAGDPPGQPSEVSSLPGFPTRTELVELYARQTGRDVGAVGFWHVLGLWKIAIILEGVRHRAVEDPRNAERGASMDPLAIDAILERAWETADREGL